MWPGVDTSLSHACAVLVVMGLSFAVVWVFVCFNSAESVVAKDAIARIG